MKRLAAVLGCSAALLLAGCESDYVYRPVEDHQHDPVQPAPRPAPRPATKPVAPSVPLANANEKDAYPRADEIPPDVGKVPDAVPQNEEKSAWGNPSSYEVFGKRYEVLDDSHGFRERGYASWYGKKFHGKRTSSGEPYNMYAMTGAHKTLPIPSYARVTNVANGKSVIIKITDRGPFHEGRIVDLSYAAATRLDLLGHGSALVELEVVTPDDRPSTVVATAEGPKITVPAEKPLQTEKPPVVVAQPAPLHVGTPRYLQAGVFADAINATAFREKLAIAGIKPLLMKSEARNNRWVYRVLIGPYADMSRLDADRARLSAGSTPTIPVVD